MIGRRAAVPPGTGATLVSLGHRADPDGLAALRPAVVAIRWCAAGASFVLAGGLFASDDPIAAVTAAVVVFTTAVVRTLRPVRDAPGVRLAVVLGAETLVLVAAVLVAGGWQSPFFVALLPTVVVAGFTCGVLGSVVLASAAALIIAIGDRLIDASPPSAALQLTAQLLLVALIAGLARRIATERDAERVAALGEAGRLAEANALLVELHAVAQTLPSSLDLDEALDATVQRVEALLDPDGVIVLLLDDTDGAWQTVRRTGGDASTRRHGAVQLPPLAYRALRERQVVYDEFSIAAPLQARDAVMGLLVVESQRPPHVRAREAELLAGLVDPAALAVDNARWFNRLRTVGAEEERSRIARDLHDRIGQSLAYLAFEIDRLVRRSEKVGVTGDELGPALDHLRNDTRGVIREVRDTLYDLRTDVTEDQGFGVVLDSVVQRIRARSGLDVVLSTEESERVPLPQERELLRIAQEALHNVERHARAARAAVTWRSDGVVAELIVADDGVGLPDRGPRSDAYGLAGMRERAASIGARLEIDSVPGNGTTVRCVLSPADVVTRATTSA